MGVPEPALVPEGLPLVWLDRVFAGLDEPIPAGALSAGLPDTDMLPRRLRLFLLDHEQDYPIRDAVWKGIVTRARTPGAAGYRLIAVGLALPGLLGYRHRIPVRHVQDVPDVQAEVLTGFLTRLGTIDPAAPNLAGRLIDSAIGYAHRRYTARKRLFEARMDSLDSAGLDGTRSTVEPVAPSADGSAEEALHQAAAALAAAGTPLAARDVELIARTRLNGQHLNAVATDLGLSVEALYKRRRRAEARLAAHLRQHAHSTEPDTPPAR